MAMYRNGILFRATQYTEAMHAAIQTEKTANPMCGVIRVYNQIIPVKIAEHNRVSRSNVAF